MTKKEIKEEIAARERIIRDKESEIEKSKQCIVNNKERLEHLKAQLKES